MMPSWLLDEIRNDPLKIGYATLDTWATLSALNDATRARPVAVRAVAAADLVVAVNPAELVAAPLPAAAQWWLERLLPVIAAQAIDPHDPRTVAIRDGLFPAAQYPKTNAAIVALGSSTGSRAEELAGAGTVLTADDVQAARQAAGFV